ncbi:hypothetical protein KR222_011294 [Zaprionus bogoriensis]|nr:hypothetical protein KR222_011294 [Zaprionus bogoriensis]
MPRMPMIAATASLLLLLLALLQTSTPASARSTHSRQFNPVTEPVTQAEEETTSFGDLNSNTVTIEVDAELILTTEDNVQMFTQLAENAGATTEEPLPESVILQLEQEREEREQRSGKTITTTTEAVPITTEKPTAAPPTTTQQPQVITTERTIQFEATSEPLANANPSSNFNEVNAAEDLEMGEAKITNTIEATTYLPQLEETGSELNSLSMYTISLPNAMSTDKPDPMSQEFSTFRPLSLEPKFTSGPFLHEEMSDFNTEMMPLGETTWMSDKAQLIESTIQPELEGGTTGLAETHNKEDTLDEEVKPDNSNVVTETVVSPFEPTTTEGPIGTTTSSTAALVGESAIVVPKLLQMLLTGQMSEGNTTTTTTTTTTATTITNDSEATTLPENADLAATLPVTAMPESTTAASMLQQMHELQQPTPTTIRPVENSEIKESTETTTVPDVRTASDAGAQPEATVAATTQLTLLEVSPTASTTRPVEVTTTAPPAATVQPVEDSTKASPTSSTTISTSSTAHPVETSTTAPETTTSSETTTVAPPATTTTTTQAPLPTVEMRAPRVERIFNSDGVEVLYGYSSVVRTNHA